MRICKILVILLLVSAFLSSCISKKDVLYFQDIETLNTSKNEISYNTTIRPNDLLSIFVAGGSPEAVSAFNPTVGVTQQNGSSTGYSPSNTYLVDQYGAIEFPLVGSITVGNLSRTEALEKLKEAVSIYVKEPVINLRIINFTISVLGEVKRPGTYSINDENISLLKALGLAGDLTIYGDRKNVVLIREANESKIYKVIDLTSASILGSEFYYLQQNDVLIVSPNKAQVQSAAFSRSTAILFSIAGLALAVITLFTR